MPGLDTFPGLLLVLVALSGEFPLGLVRRLPTSDSYQQYAVKQLKKENLLRTFYRNNLRGLRLTTTSKKLLLSNWADWFAPYLSGNTETNRLKSEIPRRLRLHCMAEVLVTMLNAGAAIFPWEKPELFCPGPLPNTPAIEQPTYYNSREIKELGVQAIKIRGSRSTGVLLADGGIFVVYNTGSGQMKWEYKAEMRLKALLQMELCQSRLSAQYLKIEQAAIVFAADMGQLAALMGVGEDKRHNYFVLDGNFEHFYYLTSDHYGEVILQLLCDAEQRAILNSILSEDLMPRRPDWLVENDAMDGEDPVLFAYTCDMPRIQRFDTALELHEKSGTLFCFDFQEDALKQVCGPRIHIQSVDFDAYEGSVFHFTEKSN